jgi:hypothetical protein
MSSPDHPYSKQSRRRILEHNARSRIERPRRDLTFGRQVLNIPVYDRQVLHITHPELDSHDPEIRDRAWRAFIQSDESLPYRV